MLDNNIHIKENPYISHICSVEALPPFPLIGSILKAFLHAEDTGDIRSLIDNIEAEPAVSAKVLSVANTAYYTSGSQVRTIRDSTARIGINNLKPVIYSLTISNKFNTRKCPQFDIAKFWVSSMTLASCASSLVELSNLPSKPNKNEVYSIALLAYIGVLALVDIFPKEMNDAFSLQNNATLRELELRIFEGMDHYDVGTILLQHWNLPECFYNTIEHLHDDFYIGPNSQYVWIIKRCQQLIDSDFSRQNTKLDELLHLDSDTLNKLQHAHEKNKLWINLFADYL